VWLRIIQSLLVFVCVCVCVCVYAVNCAQCDNMQPHDRTGSRTTNFN